MENAGFLYAAFTVIWVIVFAYVFLLMKRQSRLRRDMDLLKEVQKDEQ